MKTWIATSITALKPTLTRTELLVCLSSGLLLALAFPPFSFSFTILFALVPLFSILQPNRHRNNFKLGFWTGLVFFCFTLYWLLNVTLGGLVLLILVLSLYFSLQTLAAGWQRFPALTIPFAALVWALVEYFRSLGWFSFAWNFMGHALYSWETQLQITYWFGVYILTFFIIAMNLALAHVFLWLRRVYQTRAYVPVSSVVSTYPHYYLIGVMIFFIGNGFYGTSVIEHLKQQRENGIPFRVALIQGNFQLDEKREATQKQILATYLTLSEGALSYRPDLIVFPESTFAAPLNHWRSLVSELQTFVDEHNTDLLLGTVYGEILGQENWRFWNRAYLFKPGNVFDLSDTPIDLSAMQHYDKIHLVPYGEFVPLGSYFPFYYIETLIEEAGAGIFERGENLTLFEGRNDITFSVAICYESSRGQQISQAVENGADFIINITNDAWFRRSPGLMQHFILSVFRAVENRCYVVRCANTGITGVIEPDGTIGKVIEDNKKGMCLYELRIVKDQG
jgi:apolipoprotein N-acyltransferase